MDKTLKKFILLVVGVIVGLLTAILTAGQPEWLDDFIKQNDPSLYEVVSIADGDTIVVDMNGTEERVRLIGIDTPEKNHPEFTVQCFALEAEEYIRSLIGENKVRLEADPDNTNRDIYDRLLRFVYLPDGTFINERMVVDGYAFAYIGYSNSKLVKFQKLEESARNSNLGLWNSCEVDLQNGRPLTNPAT